MTAAKKVSIICSLVLVIAVGGFGLYEWFAKDVVNASTLFFVSMGIYFFFQSITWGEMEGKHEGDKDEMEKHITLLSSKVSYFLLLFVNAAFKGPIVDGVACPRLDGYTVH